MLKNKRGFLISLLFLVLIVVISACGGGEEEGGTDSGGGDNGGETTAVEGNAGNGEEIYQANCLSCHGQEGAGGSAPSLQDSSDYDQVVNQVKNGGGGMPVFENQLSEQEIADVSAYVAETIATMGE